ncbi:hypothetical protein OF83DRAFT_1086067 [Amylostereum chailletii]|nr:hypothetical protein OF83DRAFT_1086067 [Amylostereum chailletii]
MSQPIHDRFQYTGLRSPRGGFTIHEQLFLPGPPQDPLRWQRYNQCFLQNCRGERLVAILKTGPTNLLEASVGTISLSIFTTLIDLPPGNLVVTLRGISRDIPAERQYREGDGGINGDNGGVEVLRCYNDNHGDMGRDSIGRHPRSRNPPGYREVKHGFSGRHLFKLYCRPLSLTFVYMMSFHLVNTIAVEQDSSIVALAISPDEQLIASGNTDGKVRIYARSLRPACEDYSTGDSGASALAWSQVVPATLIVGDTLSRVHVLVLENEQDPEREGLARYGVVQIMEARVGPIWCIDVYKYLVAIGGNDGIKIMEHKPRALLSLIVRLPSVKMSPEAPKNLPTHRAASIHISNSDVLVATYNEGYIIVRPQSAWNVKNGEQVWEAMLDDDVNHDGIGSLAMISSKMSGDGIAWFDFPTPPRNPSANVVYRGTTEANATVATFVSNKMVVAFGTGSVYFLDVGTMLPLTSVKNPPYENWKYFTVLAAMPESARRASSSIVAVAFESMTNRQNKGYSGISLYAIGGGEKAHPLVLLAYEEIIQTYDAWTEHPLRAARDVDEEFSANALSCYVTVELHTSGPVLTEGFRSGSSGINAVTPCHVFALDTTQTPPIQAFAPESQPHNPFFRAPFKSGDPKPDPALYATKEPQAMDKGHEFSSKGGSRLLTQSLTHPPSEIESPLVKGFFREICIALISVYRRLHKSTCISIRTASPEARMTIDLVERALVFPLILLGLENIIISKLGLVSDPSAGCTNCLKVVCGLASTRWEKNIEHHLLGADTVSGEDCYLAFLSFSRVRRDQLPGMCRIEPFASRGETLVTVWFAIKETGRERSPEQSLLDLSFAATWAISSKSMTEAAKRPPVSRDSPTAWITHRIINEGFSNSDGQAAPSQHQGQMPSNLIGTVHSPTSRRYRPHFPSSLAVFTRGAQLNHWTCATRAPCTSVTLQSSTHDPPKQPLDIGHGVPKMYAQALKFADTDQGALSFQDYPCPTRVFRYVALQWVHGGFNSPQERMLFVTHDTRGKGWGSGGNNIETKTDKTGGGGVAQGGRLILRPLRWKAPLRKRLVACGRSQPAVLRRTIASGSIVANRGNIAMHLPGFPSHLRCNITPYALTPLFRSSSVSPVSLLAHMGFHQACGRSFGPSEIFWNFVMVRRAKDEEEIYLEDVAQEGGFNARKEDHGIGQEIETNHPAFADTTLILTTTTADVNGTHRLAFLQLSSSSFQSLTQDEPSSLSFYAPTRLMVDKDLHMPNNLIKWAFRLGGPVYISGSMESYPVDLQIKSHLQAGVYPPGFRPTTVRWRSLRNFLAIEDRDIRGSENVDMRVAFCASARDIDVFTSYKTVEDPGISDAPRRPYSVPWTYIAFGDGQEDAAAALEMLWDTLIGMSYRILFFTPVVMDVRDAV